MYDAARDFAESWKDYNDLYYVSNDKIFQIGFSNAAYSVFKVNLPNFCSRSLMFQLEI